MRFRRDRRGAALQVGAVLLLGFLVIALSLYQATVVPEENKRVEFRHSQQVQDDMVEVRNALQRTGTSEDVQAVTVDMGTTYPARVFFVNPPPPGGVLRNGSERTATFANVSATNGETADFLNSTANGPYDLDTKNLSYRPSYNVYQSAPTTTYQSGVLVNEIEDANDTAVTDQALVRGNEIYLVAVAGNLSRGQTRAYALDPESLSTATSATTIRNESGRVNVTVPTTLTEERWERLLADEGRVESVTKQGGRVSVLLENGTYRLRTALVGVGTGAEAPGARYLTNVTERETVVRAGDRIVVEVRDRYSNPAGAGEVGVNVTEGGDLVGSNRTIVGDDGRAQFTYTGGAGPRSTLNLSIDDRHVPTRNASTNVSFAIRDGGAIGGETGTNPANPSEGVILRSAVAQSQNSDVAIVRFNNTDPAQDRYLVKSRIAFYYPDESTRSATAFDINGSQQIAIGDPMTSVGNITFAAGTTSTEDIVVDFEPSGGSDAVRVGGDFFILTAKFKYYDDGETVFVTNDYFVAVRSR